MFTLSWNRTEGDGGVETCPHVRVQEALPVHNKAYLV